MCEMRRAIACEQDERRTQGRFTSTLVIPASMDVLQFSGLLAGDVKESRNDEPTRDLQTAADRSRPHTLCGPVVPSLFSLSLRDVEELVEERGL
jgi:hypothetical protein